ncbi:uncharacterized protein DSM5745_00721 [Aspergillus mulundensis]|uniref:Epidermal growth factor receptor-like transmembrane-juxtamembrane segment domain-containing protein n=1 Tax=Aspergillus mulundensis TaxID=1810919 RepID=A0A3D8T4E8_9EURO|nr:hypothetical protein DSM5745_00721 [Aspergillus mulundensis]RDW93399.1 hypothetical protein DSM5745_00721 [Aspergillus mulundensis]
MTSTSAYDPPAGYGLRRNGTCLATEETCANPYDDWHNCCPEGTYCNDDNTCCPTSSNCAAFIEADPHCANNVTWDLYDSNGYFCCLSSSYGFTRNDLVYNGTRTGGVGCADGLPDGESLTAIPPVARGVGSESATPTPTPSPADTDTATTTPTPSDADADADAETTSSSSSTNTGAIAGGVVGGVAGLAVILALIWFIMRRRRQRIAQGALVTPADSASTAAKEYSGIQQAELDDNTYRAELYGNHNAMAHELPANGR